MYHEQLKGPGGERALGYLTSERGLTPETIEHFRLGVVVEPDGSDGKYAGRISIPNIKPAGVMDLRFRALPEQLGPNGEGPKYMGMPGIHPTIFNTRVLAEAPPWICICEGEIDTITAHQIGLPAIGFPGVSMWDYRHARLLDGFSRILILQDNDDGGAGAKFAETIVEAVPDASVVPMPPGHDLNSFYLAAGAEAVYHHLRLK